MRKGEIYSRLATAAADSGDDEAQRKLQQAAAKWLGKARGGDPSRSERVRENLRARLKKQRAPRRTVRRYHGCWHMGSQHFTEEFVVVLTYYRRLVP